MRGFHPGVGQPAVQIDYRLKIPGMPDFQQIDAFMSLLLGEDYVEPIRPGGAAIATPEIPVRYAHRVLHLTSGLLRLGQIPVFADPQIIALRADPEREGGYQLTALLPQLDFLPLDFLGNALSAASSLVKRSADGMPGREELDSAYKLILQKIIQPFLLYADSGVSTLPILRAAYGQGMPFWHLGGGSYLLGMGANGRVISKSATDLDSAIGSNIANRKDSTARLLRIAGLPAPAHALVSTEAEACKAAEELGWPVVVKPADRERSEGVTTGLRDLGAVAAAFAVARKLSANVLVERHVPGVCFRLMVANKKFLYAVERRPRSIVGNGIDSIQELLRAEREANFRLPPWSRKKPLLIDEEMIGVIRTQGFDLESVPDAGVRVGLKAVESTEWGETTFDVTAAVAAENIEIVERAASVLGLNNAGVDMITTDISRPWSEVGAVINEVNFRPHFGGTAAARARMALYVASLVENFGQVPVEAYVGDAQAMDAGRERQRHLIGLGVRACLTSHQASYGVNGELRQFAGENTLSARCRALLIDKTVEAIILVVQTDEPLQLGLPVNRISALNVVNQNLTAGDNPARQVAPADAERILGLMAAFQEKKMP